MISPAPMRSLPCLLALSLSPPTAGVLPQHVPTGVARAEHARAIQLLDQGKLDEAIGAFDKVITWQPRSAEVYCERGMAYRLKKDYGRSILDLRKALRLRPHYKAAANNLAYVYRLQGDYPRAIRAYRRAAALDPRNSARWEHLTVCLCLA